MNIYQFIIQKKLTILKPNGHPNHTNDSEQLKLNDKNMGLKFFKKSIS